MNDSDGNSNEKLVKVGSKVDIEYLGTLENGEVFDKTEEGKVFSFVVGGGQVIPGFDDALIGMTIGEEKYVSIPPEKAYGYPDKDLIIEVPSSFANGSFVPEKGVVVNLKSEDGRIIPGTIVDVFETSLKIDLNHFLAGKTINFKIKLADIK